MRDRTLPAAVRIVLLVLMLAAGFAAAPAAAQDDGTTTSTSEPPESPNIIPEPGSGSEPEDAGDRGGLLQAGLLVLMVAGIALIGAFILRESRRARERRGF